MTENKENKTDESVMEQINEVQVDEAIAQEEDENIESTVDDAVTSLTAERDDLKDKLLRLAAEMENLRRRTQKEKEDAGKYAVASLARELLSVADNMMRAVDHAPKEMDKEPEYVQNLFSGINATHDQLIKAMNKMGIHAVRIEGVFDPNMHEVMFEVPNTGKPAGTIIQVIEPGYMIHDRLLRPARVGVAAKEAGGQTAVDVNA